MTSIGFCRQKCGMRSRIFRSRTSKHRTSEIVFMSTLRIRLHRRRERRRSGCQWWLAGVYDTEVPSCLSVPTFVNNPTYWLSSLSQTGDAVGNYPFIREQLSIFLLRLALSGGRGVSGRRTVLQRWIQDRSPSPQVHWILT